MSDLLIPCQHPWRPVAYDKAGVTMKFRVGNGTNLREYDLHTAVLKDRSEYFRSKLSELGTAQKPPTINFPDEKPSVFEAFTIWLYQGTISRSNPEVNFSYLILCQLYGFAMAFGVPLLRNTIVNIVLTKLYRDAPSIPYDITPFLAQHLRDTALRNLVLDIVLNCGEIEEVQEWGISLAKGFYKCSAFMEDGVVPFEMKSDMRGYLRQLKDHACGMYHEHPTGDETKRDVGEVLFFFDPASKRREDVGGV